MVWTYLTLKLSLGEHVKCYDMKMTSRWKTTSKMKSGNISILIWNLGLWSYINLVFFSRLTASAWGWAQVIPACPICIWFFWFTLYIRVTLFIMFLICLKLFHGFTFMELFVLQQVFYHLTLLSTAVNIGFDIDSQEFIYYTI